MLSLSEISFRMAGALTKKKGWAGIGLSFAFAFVYAIKNGIVVFFGYAVSYALAAPSHGLSDKCWYICPMNYFLLYRFIHLKQNKLLFYVYDEYIL